MSAHSTAPFLDICARDFLMIYSVRVCVCVPSWCVFEATYVYASVWHTPSVSFETKNSTKQMNNIKPTMINILCQYDQKQSVKLY